MGDPRAREQLPPQITPAYLRKLLDVFQVAASLHPCLLQAPLLHLIALQEPVAQSA